MLSPSDMRVMEEKRVCPCLAVYDLHIGLARCFKDSPLYHGGLFEESVLQNVFDFMSRRSKTMILLMKQRLLHVLASEGF